MPIRIQGNKMKKLQAIKKEHIFLKEFPSSPSYFAHVVLAHFASNKCFDRTEFVTSTSC